MSKKRDEVITISKRGLSEVVTTLVIILISLVAIGVIWVVVQNVIQEGSEQIELGEFTLDLQIKAVQVQDENVTVVVVKRNPGEGEFVGMNFVFSDGQNSEIIRENTTLAELDQKSFTFELSTINTSNLVAVSVAPIYMLSTGSEKVGNLADQFDVPANKSLGTEQNGGAGTGQIIIGPPTEPGFAGLGYSGVGEKTYTIPSSPGETIRFTSYTVDPLDVLPGDNQTFTVYISSDNEVVDVTSVTELDNSVLNLDFVENLDTGTASVWSGSWIVNDTHNIEYRTNVTATDELGNKNSITLTWTDSCQSAINQSQDVLISTSCTTGMNFLGGIDGGSLTIGTGVTVTIDSGSKLYFNQGESISIPGSGKIVSTGTGSFGNANLYYPGSGTTATNATPVAVLPGQSPPANHIRVKDTTLVSNCTASTSLVGPCSASCTDTDGGNIKFEQGIVTVRDGSCNSAGCRITVQQTDACLDSVKLSEYYCNGLQLGGETIFCTPQTCSAGACGGGA